MAAIAGKKKANNWSNDVQLVRAVYDFSVDGGATGTLDIVEATDNMVIHSAYINVKTAATSGGSATVAIGVDTDVDAVVDETAVASLTANALIVPVTNNPIKVASGKMVNLTIADATLLTGKLEVVLLVSKF